MKVIQLGDVHLGLKADSVPMHNFYNKVYTEWFFKEVDRLGISTIYQFGDLFDKRKTVDFFSLSGAREYFFDQLKKRGIEMITLLGNHDVFYKNTLSISAPELLLKDYDNITIIKKPTSIDGIDLIPWVCTDNYAEIMEFVKESKNKFCFGHFEFAGFPMYRGMTSEHGFDPAIFKRYKKVFSGHYHTRSTGKNIEYIGTPMEMTWNDYDDPRGFNVFDTETGETEFHQNPFTLFQKLYYDEDKPLPDVELARDKYVRLIVEKRTDVKKYEKYLEKLNAAGPIELKTVEDFTALDGKNVADTKVDVKDTKELLESYVDEVDTDLDKTAMKEILNSLYVEALTLE